MAVHLRFRPTTLAWLLVSSWLVGCAHQPSSVSLEKAPGAAVPSVRERAPVSGPRRYVLNEALEMLGTPYRYGGTSPRGFDCSGLVYYSHRQAGIHIPRTAQEQRMRARPVSLRTLRPGDLLFFRLDGRKVNHVGIYTGNGQFVHAPSSGKTVSKASLDNPYWDRHLIGAGNYY